MRIAVDATCWSNGRGYGRFARELVSALVSFRPSDTFICVGDRSAFEAFPIAGANVELVEVPLSQAPTAAAASEGYRSPADMLRLSWAVHGARARVFFSPSVYTWFPLVPGQRAVVTVHDAIVERFPELTLPSRRARLFWHLKVRAALWQSRLILTPSAYAARDISRVIGVASERIRVCGEAPAETYQPSTPLEVQGIRHRFALGTDPYFVYVGGFNPHKRVDALIEAHAKVVRAADRAPWLVLVGRISGDVFHGETARLMALSERAGASHRVKWVGFVPDEELRHLHTGATAVALVSESEGYGLPAIEGAACGAAVIATTESPLPELLEGGGIFVPPGDVEAIASAMQTLLQDDIRRSECAATALRRTRALSWNAAAQATWSVLEEAAA